jgi:hypothetical protein
MSSLQLAFLIVACVLFLIAAIGIPQPPRGSIVAAGLFFWSLSEIIGRM